jgi:hypothetical protein
MRSTTWLALMRRPTWRWLFRREGIADPAATTNAEIDAYLTLLKRLDRGRAFLKIMRGFELTPEKQRFYDDGLASRPRRWSPPSRRWPVVIAGFRCAFAVTLTAKPHPTAGRVAP